MNKPLPLNSDRGAVMFLFAMQSMLEHGDLDKKIAAVKLMQTALAMASGDDSLVPEWMAELGAWLSDDNEEIGRFGVPLLERLNSMPEEFDNSRTRISAQLIRDGITMGHEFEDVVVRWGKFAATTLSFHFPFPLSKDYFNVYANTVLSWTPPHFEREVKSTLLNVAPFYMERGEIKTKLDGWKQKKKRA